MRNLVYRRSRSGKTCLRLVDILSSPITMTGNFCSIFNDTTGKKQPWQVRIKKWSVRLSCGMKIVFSQTVHNVQFVLGSWCVQFQPWHTFTFLVQKNLQQTTDLVGFSQFFHHLGKQLSCFFLSLSEYTNNCLHYVALPSLWNINPVYMHS